MVGKILRTPKVYLFTVKHELRGVTFLDNYFFIDKVVDFALGKLTGSRSLTLTPLV
jgi:hypothetical protein